MYIKLLKVQSYEPPGCYKNSPRLFENQYYNNCEIFLSTLPDPIECLDLFFLVKFPPPSPHKQTDAMIVLTLKLKFVGFSFSFHRSHLQDRPTDGHGGL